MELISDDDGNHFDLHTLKGNYEYLAAYLRKKVAASNIFASLGFIYQESINLQQRLSTAEADLEREQQSVNELSLHCQEVEAERDRLREEYKNLQEDFNGRLKPSYDYVDGVAVSVAEDEIDRIGSELVTVQAERAEDKKLLSHLNDKLLEFKTELDRLRAENERLRNELVFVHRRLSANDESYNKVSVVIGSIELRFPDIAKQALGVPSGKD